MSLRRILRAVPLDRESVVHLLASDSLLHATAFYSIDTILDTVSGLDGDCWSRNLRARESSSLLSVEWKEAEI